MHKLFFFSSKNRMTYETFFLNIIGMEGVVRKTHGYKFKKPDMESLRKLARRLTDLEHIRKRYGFLLRIVKADVDEGLLNTLIQFYDPRYQCFTFSDYQLVPTLEEYSFWVGKPVLDEVPFHGLEVAPKIPDIVAAFHLESSEVKAHLATKGGLQCLPYNFLYQKATDFADSFDANDFETILTLIIYGIVLLPNVDRFVDMNVIRIFLTQNHVPTLLADTYFTIHDRTIKARGTILCCTHLLNIWITSHLPRPELRPVYRPWSEKIMTLTHNDIVWCNTDRDFETIIDRCGEFSNVPLLGTRGGISYSPILARR